MKMRYLLPYLMLSSPVFMLAFLPAITGTGDIKNEIKEAATELTPTEKRTLKTFITSEINRTNKQALKNQLKAIQNDFRQRKYGFMAQQLVPLYTTIGRKPNVPALRMKLLTNELSGQPGWLQEIAALEYILKKDTKRNVAIKRWKTPNTRAKYVLSLARNIAGKHSVVTDDYLIKDAIAIVENRLTKFKPMTRIPASTKNDITEVQAKLKQIKQQRNLDQLPAIAAPTTPEKPSFPGIPTPTPKAGDEGFRYDPEAPTHTPEGRVIYY